MKQCKKILLIITILMLTVYSNTAVSYAEEIDQEKGEQDSNTQIQIENLQELEEIVYEYPVGTTEEEIKASLPDKVVGYDSNGKEYEITVSWEVEGEYSADAVGDFVYRAIPLDDGYNFLCDLPELTISIAEQKEIPENIPDDTEQLQLRMGEEDAPSNLKINLLSQPLGIIREKMSFSWENSLERNMTEQSAYRIVISSRISQTETGEYVYDSGWQEDNSNTSVLLDLSDLLQDNELYYWQVQIRNIEGEESSLSLPQAFSTAVGDEWSSKQGIWGSSEEKVIFLRREIDIPEDVEKAVLSVTALDGTKSRQYVYNMYVNGEEIGLGPVRPDGNKLDYDTYDITEQLQSGKNVLGTIAYAESNQAFLCQLAVYFSDGSKQIITNSGQDRGNWKVLDADTVFVGNVNSSIGTALNYSAIQDNLDMTKYPEGWLEVGFSKAGWISPAANNRFASYTLRPSQNDHYKHYGVYPQSVERQTDGSYLVDFGKEIIGTIRLSVNSSSGNILLQYGEELDDQGNAKYEMATGNVYQETWKLRNGQQTAAGIGMKAFRYVTIKNCPVNLSTENIIGLTVRNAFDDDASSFSSSNEILNQVYEMSKYTSKMTTQGLYVDTQSRERLPYEGDALITGMLSYSFSDTSTAFKYTSEYLLNNTTWPAEYSLYNIMTVYQNYLYTGDIRTLEESYQLLKKKTWEELYDSNQGLMGKSNGDSPRIMVDWPTSETDGYNFVDSYYNTVFNAVCVGGYEDMAAIAGALGYTDEQSYYQGLADTIRTNMIEKLYDSSTGRFFDGMTQNGKTVQHSAQHATAYALAFGIYRDQAMADAMASSIESDEAIEMSVYGSYFLLQGLYESNHGTIARKLMSNPEETEGVKSWAYMMNGLGATISAEAWNYSTKLNMSLSHAWGAAPGSMLIRGMFGIRPTSPGFDSFEVKLQPGGVKSASVKLPTMKGSIEASYTIQDSGNISCDIQVPSNATAAIYIPVGTGSGALSVDGVAQVPLNDKEGYTGCVLEPGAHSIEVQAGVYEDTSELLKTDAVIDAYTSGGWNGEKTNGLTQGNISGTTLEAIKVRIRNADAEGGVEYQTYMQSYGWQDISADEAVNGLPGGGKRMEAVKINLTGALAEKYDIYYRVYAEGWGWLDWAQNGEAAGSSGYAKGIKAIEVKMLRNGEAAPGERGKPYYSLEWTVGYSTHVQSYGWQAEVGDGDISGTTGEAKRLEAIRIHVNMPDVSGDIMYSTHVQSYGWLDWVKNGKMSGTEGQAKRLEAIKIKLTGDLEKQYDIYYRVHAQSYGWLGWAKNGEEAGTEGMAKRLEAIQIRLVKKGDSAPGSTERHFIEPLVTYQTHVQSYGWQSTVYDGGTSGTEGQAKRLEGIKINLYDPKVSGNIQYRTHVQTYGWQNWVENGQMSGTTGRAKRLEAICIRLTGEMSKKYDIYYRVHSQSYGWLGWAKNGGEAGTEGLAKRLEAIQIVLVEKGDSAPGSTENCFVKPQVTYQTHVQSYGWQGLVCDGETSGTSGQAKRLEAIRINLHDPEVTGDIEYATHVQSYGWMNWVSNGALSGTEGQAKRLEAIKIRLTGEMSKKYDIYYRVHAQSYGWLGWAKNGEEAGTEGQAKRLEAIQIVLVERGGEALGSTEGAFVKTGQ